MNDHFFIADSGELFDTRVADWSRNPLRANYRKHHRTIESVADFKACLRAGRFTDLGGYPLFFLTVAGDAISFESAQKDFGTLSYEILHSLGGRIIACDVNYEDSDLVCAISNERIPSAYGDEWSGSPDPTDPDNFWIDDATGERVNAVTGERTKAQESDQ